jgi:hypothetical protein
VLASLLPGLRDVRTPLAVGYLWLLCAWLAWGEHFPRLNTNDDGVVANLFDLHDRLGDAVGLAAVSFTAYVLGVLLTLPIEGGMALGLLGRWLPSPGASIADFEYSKYVQTLHADAREAITRAVRRGAMSASEASSMTERLNQAPDKDGSLKTVQPFRKADMRVRLLVANQELYGEYDRLASEAAFRVNVAAPLLVLSGIVASEFGWLILLVTFAIAIVLIIQGFLKLRQSVAVLRRAVITETIKHPVALVLEEARAVVAAGPPEAQTQNNL